MGTIVAPLSRLNSAPRLPDKKPDVHPIRHPSNYRFEGGIDTPYSFGLLSSVRNMNRPNYYKDEAARKRSFFSVTPGIWEDGISRLSVSATTLHSQTPGSIRNADPTRKTSKMRAQSTSIDGRSNPENAPFYSHTTHMVDRLPKPQPIFDRRRCIYCTGPFYSSNSLATFFSSLYDLLYLNRGIFGLPPPPTTNPPKHANRPARSPPPLRGGV